MTEKPTRIIRGVHDSDNHYFVCTRITPKDRTLSWEARGVLWYLLSQANNWEVQPKDLQQGCGRDKVYKLLAELQEHRYIVREENRDDNGKFIEFVYKVYEHPLPEKAEVVIEAEPFPDLPDTANTHIKELDISTEIKTPAAPEEGAEPELKVVKPRKRNPLYDAVELHIFEITDSAEDEVGRIVKIANWLAGSYEGKGKERMGKISSPAEASHVRLFAEYCKHKNISPPLDFVKFVENWRKWASGLKQKAAAPAWQPVVAPAATSTPALSQEERQAMLEQTRARRGALLGQMSANADMEEAS